MPPDLQATSKADAIREIVARLAATGTIDRVHEESIARAILERENLGSTGVGEGLAVPHAEHPLIDHPIGTMAISRKGIDFQAIDGQPVHTIFLYVCPTDQPDACLRALEHVSRFLRPRDSSS